MKVSEIQDFTYSFNAVYSDTINLFVKRAISYGENKSVSLFVEHLKALSRDGKRFRPYAVYFSYSLYGGKENIDKILQAVELLHFFALIHDDVMDKGVTRHDIETSHVLASRIYKEIGDNDFVHRGYSQAILLGNLVFSWSYYLFTEGLHSLSIDEEQKKKAFFCFQSLIEEVNVGQMIDVDISSKDDIKIDEILVKNKLKSGNYTFVWPLLLGATICGVDESKKENIRLFGERLGSLFQAQDDLLDVLGTAGKSFCSDIETGQQTLVTNFMLYHPDESVRKKFAFYWRKSLTIESKEEVKKLILESGASDFIEREIENLSSELESLINKSNEEEKESYIYLCTLVKNRKK